MATKVLSNDLACEAMTVQLRALSIIDDNQVVNKFKKVPEGWEVHIGKEDK